MPLGLDAKGTFGAGRAGGGGDGRSETLSTAAAAPRPLSSSPYVSHEVRGRCQRRGARPSVGLSGSGPGTAEGVESQCLPVPAGVPGRAVAGGAWEPPAPAQPGCRGDGAGATLQCRRAAGPALRGDRSGSAAPRGCRFAPPSLSVCRSLPAHTGGCILDGDTDPCQGQLGEINMLGLKGLRAPAGSGL